MLLICPDKSKCRLYLPTSILLLFQCSGQSALIIPPDPHFIAVSVAKVPLLFHLTPILSLFQSKCLNLSSRPTFYCCFCGQSAFIIPPNSHFILFSKAKLAFYHCFSAQCGILPTLALLLSHFICPFSRAGHFRCDFFCVFYQVINLFLHQSYL